MQVAGNIYTFQKYFFSVNYKWLQKANISAELPCMLSLPLNNVCACVCVSLLFVYVFIICMGARAQISQKHTEACIPYYKFIHNVLCGR